MKELPKAYESQQYEDGIYQKWEKSGYFNPDNLSGDPYSIMMPPPNVTGVLHLGHALENSLMDIMARFQRMNGKKVLLLPGTDHAAVATQARVEKNLAKEGILHPREELGREELLKRIREFAEQSKATILGQVRKMGTSADWSRLAYTFDEERNLAVRELFTRMYNDGLIYRGYRVVNWSVKGQSTSADDEIEHVERAAKLYTFKYSKDFPITIATTRPETKLGDTAVAVHPDDERYQHLIGQTFIVDVGAAKLLNIKIIADESVEATFGTGALGVTPAHSAIDFVMYEKQKAKGDPIELIAVIGPDGKMTAEAGPQYAGLTVEEAREKFVAWLSTEGLLEKEEDIVQNVGTSDRYGDIIEAIPMTQWWLDVTKVIPQRGKNLRDLMREAVTTGLDNDPSKKVVITPERFTKLYLDRVENLRDWCLSRQIWWGHQIPVWYKGEEIYVGVNAPEGEGWEQDPDTLDTWFSSGSWTFSTLGWPKETKDFKEFTPTSWIQMGYEILYLWLMRMILMNAYALQDIPFKDAYIHGILRDQHGNKFSKSSGNGIDPIDVINQYGCDALRFSVIGGISPGNDSRFYTEKIEGARNLVNKIWNISRFMLTNIQDPKQDIDAPAAKTLADQWILARLDETAKAVGDHITSFNFSHACERLRDFTWDDLADWYLEVAKIEGEKSEMLNYILNTLLKLWHPVMPFVTEAIWQEVYGGDRMLIVERWPASQHREPVQDFAVLKDLVTGIRALRNEYGIEAGKKVSVIMQNGEKTVLVKENEMVVKGLARIETIDYVDVVEKTASLAGVVVSGIELYLDVAQSVDVEKETARLKKEIETVAPYVLSLEKKLSNAEFVNNAPEAVIAKEKEKLQEAKEKLEKITAQLDSLSS